MAGTKNKNVIKRSVSFSPLVNQWAEEMATARGYTNFSAFMADLVREARDTAPAPGKPLALARTAASTKARIDYHTGPAGAHILNEHRKRK